jgi:bacillithiol system protein YtxJ
MGQKEAGGHGDMFTWFIDLLRSSGSLSKEWDDVEELDSSAALAACLDRSNSGPVFIFKHSTRCPVSSDARAEVEDYLRQADASSPPVYINYVVESRPVSNEIESRLGLRHESPQILLVSGGRVAWSTTHGGVRSGAMVGAVAKLKSE